MIPAIGRSALLALFILAGACLSLFLENRSLRSDQDRMLTEYDKFMSVKVKGKPIADLVKPGKVAFVQTPSAVVSCAQIAEVP